MSIIDCVVSNVAIAAVLALVAVLAGRIISRPQITHTLWVLVLVKLVTPPVVHLPVSHPLSRAVEMPAVLETVFTANDAVSSMKRQSDVPVGSRPESGNAADFVGSPQQAPSVAPVPIQMADAGNSSRYISALAVPWTKVLVGVWVTGALLWFLLAGTRLFRFRKLLRYAHPASEAVLAEVSSIASRYDLHKVPACVGCRCESTTTHLEFWCTIQHGSAKRLVEQTREGRTDRVARS